MTLPGSDDARVAELDRLDALEAGDDRDLQALVALAAQVVGVPKVAINLISADAQHQVAAYGFDPGVCAREDSMCAAVLPEPEPVVVPDARLDERFASNPFVTGEIGEVRFYASSPLVTRRGVHIGRLCAFDDVPHPDVAQPEGLGAGGLGVPAALPLLADRVVDILELRMRSRELEQAVADLSRTRAELARSNARLSTFAQQVSHDLRNPLTALLASVELIESEPALADDAELLGLVAGARRAGQRMSGLIATLLEQARPVGTRSSSSPGEGPTRVQEVVDQVREDLAVLLGDDATVTVAGDAEVRLDPGLLHVVLLNLVGNAVKFTRPLAPPAVTVTVSDLVGAEAGQQVRVEVADNGPGVPPEQRDLVWAPYVRLQPEVDGTGIGLPAVRALVEDAGGTVGLDESPAGGLLVWVELPASRPRRPGDPPAA